MSESGATLTATFQGIRPYPAPQSAGFRIGTTSGNWTSTVYTTDLLNSANGSFSAELTGLTEGTKYYYQAFMEVWDGESSYVTIESSIGSFTTSSASQTTSQGYLSCYEVPEVTVSGNMASGNEASNRGYKWYRFRTTDSNRAVATHTYKETTSGPQIRNYTVLLDGSKKTPVWTAHAMHASMWADNNVGRNDGWTSDPAFTGLGDWQQENSTDGYGKGHLVASNYRQTTVAQNKQTFYLSNQAAQWQTGFNDGIWNTLEQKVANNIPSGRDTLYVVSGVLYEGTTQNNSGVQIPSHFYKCLLKCSFNTSGEMIDAKGCAYLFKNPSSKNECDNLYDGHDYSEFITTIKAVEDRAGFTFFPKAVKNTTYNGRSVVVKETAITPW